MSPTTIGFLLPGAVAPLLIVGAAILGISGFRRYAAFLLVAAFSSLVLAPFVRTLLAGLPEPLRAVTMPGGLTVAGLILSLVLGRRWLRLPASSGALGRGLASSARTRIGRILSLGVVLWASFWLIISAMRH